MTALAGWATATEAAAYLGYKQQTLANWRSQRRGPKFTKVNRAQVRYLYADLDTWMRAQSHPDPSH